MRRLTLKTVSVAAVLLVLAVLLMFAASEAHASGKVRLSITLQHVGSFMLASVVVAAIFQFWQVRGLLEDMWEEAGIIRSLRSARLSLFALEFEDTDVPWAEYFKESDRVNIMFAYGRTWRGRHGTQLRDFVKNKNAKLRVILPNPEEESLMQELGRRFDLSSEDVKSRIIEAQQDFFGLEKVGKAEIEVYAFSKPMVFSFYQFDSYVVMATYRHRSDRGAVINMAGKRGGELYKFVQDEWNWLVDEGIEKGLLTRIDQPGAAAM